MKSLLINSRHSSALLDFIKNEVINAKKEIEGVIDSNNSYINKENIYLYECFEALSKNFTINEIMEKKSLWFPYGILISANEFSYETVKKYVLYLCTKYNIRDKDLFFEPILFFQMDDIGKIIEDINVFFENYKMNYDFIQELKNKLEKFEDVYIKLDEKKFLQTKYIINIDDKNKDFLEFLLDLEIFNGNSTIDYNGKDTYLLEYLLVRSLSASKQIIRKLILTVNNKILNEIKYNIEKLDLSYLKSFKEEDENFQENMHLVDKKLILLRFEEEERESSGSSSKGIIKI